MMLEEIRNVVLKLKSKQIRKKMRAYLSIGYLIAYMWIGFLIFALIENNTIVIPLSIVPLMLSVFLIPKIGKSRKSLRSLKNMEIQPDEKALLKYSNQLGKSCKDFLCKVKTVMLVLDFEKDATTRTEGQITVIYIFLYLFVLILYMENMPSNNELYRDVGIFLSSIGVAVFIVIPALYFKFIKRASEFLVRRNISSFVKENRNHVRNIIAALSASQNLNVNLNEETIRKVSVELTEFDNNLSEIENALKGHQRSIAIPLASVLASSAVPLIPFLFGINFQFQNSSLQIQLTNIMLLLAFFFPIVLLMIPIARKQNLLVAFKVIENEEKITKDIRNMMSSSLGKELSDVASESLHVAG